MEESRRRVLWLGLGLFVTGCSSQLSSNTSIERPDVDWPDSPSRPRADRSKATAVKPTTTPKSGPARTTPIPPPTQQAGKPPIPPPNVTTASKGLPRNAYMTEIPAVTYVPRAKWADSGPMMERIVPMGDINKITVHHEGWNPVVFTDMETTAERLELIRRSHIQRLGAGDIGYHYVVDRGGRVWQAREERYQGAHVRGNNENNLGIMCLGNFDIQSPSSEQLRSLVAVIKAAQAEHKVSLSNVKTHQEINPTACPGKVLQAYMIQIRKNKTLV